MDFIFSDLHIHSRFSRATSKYITFPELLRWSKLKGINLLGTGDIIHPKWLQEANENLEYDDSTGFYKMKPEIEDKINHQLPTSVKNIDVSFIPTVETSHIYKQDDKLRRVHLVIILPTLEDAKKLSDKMATFSNISADGRPIFGMNVRDFTELVLEINDKALIIPAHIWTPHFSVFGSKSGFDSLQEAFKDMSQYIYALETGLSSDPEMNRLVKELDKYTLVSNSDSHSLPRIGREANIHTELKNYDQLIHTLKTGKNLYGTIEYFPEEGKYHYDGHRNCNISLHPQETQKINKICPKCKKPLTVGVLSRVYELAKNNTQPNTQLLNKHKSVHAIPLDDILASILGTSRTSKKVTTKLFDTISNLGPELTILSFMPLKEISKYDPVLANAIGQMRKGEIRIIPGYDGEYGIVQIDKKLLEKQTNQMQLL